MEQWIIGFDDLFDADQSISDRHIYPISRVLEWGKNKYEKLITIKAKDGR